MTTMLPEAKNGVVVDGRVLLMVAASTSATALAGYISEFCRQDIEVRVRALGGGAVNQAIKACAISRKMLGDSYELTIAPMFETIQIQGQDRSAMTMVVLVKGVS